MYQLQTGKRTPRQKSLLHLLQKIKMATQNSNLQTMQTKNGNPRKIPLRWLLQLHFPFRQKQSIQSKKTKQRRPKNLPKNNQILRNMRLQQNSRPPPHRLKQIKQLPKKPHRHLSKPPQNDSQLQLPKRNLPNTQRKRIRSPIRRKNSFP